MKIRKRIVAAIACLAMVTAGCGNQFATKVKAAEEVETKDSWIDPGNYTRGWFDVVTGRDIYGNEGTKEDPYEIKNAKDLAGLSYYSNIVATDSATTDFGGKYIDIKAKKLDLSEHYWYPIGSAQDFKGNIEGNGITLRNVYIGSAEKYETCGRVGFFGSIYGDVKNISIKNSIIYSNSSNAGGFAAIWNGGNIENCSVEGQMYQIASSSNVGGFIGYHTNANYSVKNCYAKVPVTAPNIESSSVGGFVGNTNTATTYSHCYATGDVSLKTGNLGGFVGYSNVSTFDNCTATGNVVSGGSSCVGGFIGRCDNGIQKECGATGNVSSVGGYVAGFSGYIRIDSVYNSYALGNVSGGNSTYAAGFIAYAWNNYDSFSESYYGSGWCARQYGVSMNIENCYAAGSTKTGTNGLVSGFFGSRQYDYTSITFKKCYWNDTADQVLDGNHRSDLQKVAVAYMDCRTAVGTHQNYMKTSDFTSDLNEFVYQNSDYTQWENEENVNNNYPFIKGTREILITIKGDEKKLPITDQESLDSMKVYGTLIFPGEEEAEQSPEPEDTQIQAGLKWGSLQYVYTAGEYNKETKEYAPGTWEPKEAGVTDLITVTNQTEVDIQASYAFLASLGGDGKYKNLTGTFVQEDQETVMDKPVFVRSKQGDIAGVQNAYLKINGVPETQKSVDVPEVIGTVIVTVSKYIEPEKEEEPEVTEPTPVESEDPDTPASKDPEVSEPVLEVSQAPAQTPSSDPSEEPVQSETPSSSEEPEPVQTEEVKASENPIEPVETAEPVKTDAPIDTPMESPLEPSAEVIG